MFSEKSSYIWYMGIISHLWKNVSQNLISEKMISYKQYIWMVCHLCAYEYISQDVIYQYHMWMVSHFCEYEHVTQELISEQMNSYKWYMWMVSHLYTNLSPKNGFPRKLHNTYGICEWLFICLSTNMFRQISSSRYIRPTVCSIPPSLFRSSR